MRNNYHKGKLERDLANEKRNERLAVIFNQLKVSACLSNKKLAVLTGISESQLNKLLGSRTLNFQDYQIRAFEKVFGVNVDRETLEVQLELNLKGE